MSRFANKTVILRMQTADSSRLSNSILCLAIYHIMIFAFSALSIAHKQPFCTELQRRDAIDKLLFRRHRRRHCRQRLPTFVVWHSNPSTRTVSITCRCVDVSMTFVAPNSFGIFIYQIPHFIHTILWYYIGHFMRWMSPAHPDYRAVPQSRTTCGAKW